MIFYSIHRLGVSLMAKRRRGIPGLSFSWKRALGISGAKARISRQIGIPLTRSGRQRKVGRALGCCVPLVLFAATAGIAIFYLVKAIATVA